MNDYERSEQEQPTVEEARSRRQPDSTLLALDFRWPSPFLVGAFRQSCANLALELRAKSPDGWPKMLVPYLKRRLQTHLQSVPKDDLDTVKWLLREASGLGAMLMHLEVGASSTNKRQLVNRRRTRTDYGTYPTSPRVAEAVANYILAALAPWAGLSKRPFQIMDPTMEGGPLLLEIAFQAQLRTPNQDGRNEHAYDLLLSGIDQNPAAVPIVSNLLKTWRFYSGSNFIKLDLRRQDAFEALTNSGPLDAIVNNPPWGARTDGANGDRLVRFGPYVGYRDPYIAFVALGISRLQPGRPFAFVLPVQLLTATSAQGLREELLENSQLDHVVMLPRNAFPHATVRTMMLLGRRRPNGERRRCTSVIRYPMTRRLCDSSFPTIIRLSMKATGHLNSAPWMSMVRSEPSFTPAGPTRLLADLAQVALGIEPYRIGRGQPKQTRDVLELRPFTFGRARKGTTPVVRSRDIARFRVGPVSEYVKVGRWLAASGRHLEFARRPRVFVRQICGRDGSLVAAVAPVDTVARYGVFTIVANHIAPDILCALLNSEAVSRFVRSHCAGYHKESFGRITVHDLRNLPVPKALVNGEQNTREKALCSELRRAVTNAVFLADNGRFRVAKRAAAKIDQLIELAFGWSTPVSD